MVCVIVLMAIALAFIAVAYVLVVGLRDPQRPEDSEPGGC